MRDAARRKNRSRTMWGLPRSAAAWLGAILLLFGVVLIIESLMLPRGSERRLPLLSLPATMGAAPNPFSVMRSSAESLSGVLVGTARPAALRAMQRPPNISVVVSCFGHSAFLEEALASLVDQKYPPAEIIIVDDGSEDACGEVAQRILGPQVVPDALNEYLALAMLLVHERSLGPDSRRSEAECEAIGRRVQRVVLPYLLLTETSERLYAKPRGYAGDSVSIEGIYANQAAGRGRLGPLLDACFLAEPAAQAVRNRRGLLAEEIRAVLARTPERPVQITTMACGPAREVCIRRGMSFAVSARH